MKHSREEFKKPVTGDVRINSSGEVCIVIHHHLGGYVDVLCRQKIYSMSGFHLYEF